jgi:uncharacterized protein YbjT (DUF2867 family)
MRTQPVLAVLGATGAQGGGLVRAALEDPAQTFRVRAITRHPDSPAALALGAMGASIVAGDVDQGETLRAALAGADALFAVTDFWSHRSPEREILQAANIADAACRAGISHVVWSTLEDTRLLIPPDSVRFPTIGHRWKVPHFDAKGEADALFARLPTTYLYTSFFWDNLIHFGMTPKRGSDGRLGFLLPMGTRSLPGIAAEDIGPCALALFKLGGAVVGQRVGIAGEHLSGPQMAMALSGALREQVHHVDMTQEAYAALPLPGAPDLANMFAYKHDFNGLFCALRSVAETRRLHPALHDFKAWLTRHAARIPIAAAGT